MIRPLYCFSVAIAIDISHIFAFLTYSHIFFFVGILFLSFLYILINLHIVIFVNLRIVYFESFIFICT